MDILMKCTWFVLFICCLSNISSNLYQGLCAPAITSSPLTQIETYQQQLARDSTSIDIRLKLAKVYLQVEGYTKAKAEYRQVISSVENNPKHLLELTDGYYGLGLAYSGLEKFDKAIETYKSAIQYMPDRAHIHAALGAAYVSLHQYDKAMEAYKTANKLQPSDAMIHHQLGNIYNKQGKRQEAILHQQKAIAISPKLASAHYQLGLLYTQENRLEDAVIAYKTAYHRDPELIQVLYNLSQVHRRNGNNEEARKQMQLFEERKAEVKPIQKLRGALQRTLEQSERARIFANIGRLYLRSENYKKAVSQYEKALALDPQVAEAYNGIGIALVMLERYSDAIAAQNKALAIRPDFAEAYAGLGLVYLMQKSHELALRHYQKAITLCQNKPKFEEEIHHKIGLILLNQKKYPDAVISFQTALKLNPKNVEAYHNLGLCYAHQEKTEAALISLKKAVEIIQNQQVTITDQPHISPKQASFLPETYYLIGDLYAQQKDYDEAKSAYLTSGLPKAYDALAQLTAKLASTYEKPNKRTDMLDSAVSYAQTAIRLNPEVASYHNTFALICFRKGDYKTAETSIRKAIALDPTNPNYQEGLKQIQKIKSQQ